VGPGGARRGGGGGSRRPGFAKTQQSSTRSLQFKIRHRTSCPYFYTPPAPAGKGPRPGGGPDLESARHGTLTRTRLVESLHRGRHTASCTELRRSAKATSTGLLPPPMGPGPPGQRRRAARSLCCCRAGAAGADAHFPVVVLRRHRRGGLDEARGRDLLPAPHPPRARPAQTAAEQEWPTFYMSGGRCAETKDASVDRK
jgi:hypothetical protein